MLTIIIGMNHEKCNHYKPRNPIAKSDNSYISCDIFIYFCKAASDDKTEIDRIGPSFFGILIKRHPFQHFVSYTLQFDTFRIELQFQL